MDKLEEKKWENLFGNSIKILQIRNTVNIVSYK